MRFRTINEHDDEDGDTIATTEGSEQWTTWRRELTRQMYNDLIDCRGA